MKALMGTTDELNKSMNAYAKYAVYLNYLLNKKYFILSDGENQIWCNVQQFGSEKGIIVLNG